MKTMTNEALMTMLADVNAKIERAGLATGTPADTEGYNLLRLRRQIDRELLDRGF